MSFGASSAELPRRGAALVDKVLKGAKPRFQITWPKAVVRLPEQEQGIELGYRRSRWF